VNRPLGVSITAVWLGILLAALAALAIVFWRGTASVVALVAVASFSRVVIGVWKGEWSSYQFVRWLLVAGFVVNLLLVFAPQDKRGPLHRSGKATLNAIWALYMFRPAVRAYFAQSPATAP
jgi:hypothetical protein